MGWQDAPIVKEGSPTVQPAWMSAPVIPPTPKPDPIATANAEAQKNEHGPVQDVIDMVKAIPGGILPALKSQGEAAVDPTGAALRAAGGLYTALSHPQQTITSVGSALENATPQQVGQNVVAPIVAGGAAGKLGGLAGSAVEGSAGAAAAAEPAAVTQFGMKTGASQPIARNVAGASAQPAVAAHNQAIADSQLGAQVGVNGPPSVKALEAAKDVPNAVYARVEAALPTGPLSPNAAQMVQNVGADDLVVHSPDTQSLIDAQKQRLLSGNLTGGQVVDTQRALRYNGFKNNNLPDPENQALGKAQLQLSDALHQHMVDTLPPDADVSVDQLTQARQSLAQIHTLQDAARGNNIDLSRLAKVHRDNPGLLTGPMADIAEFADLHPEVTHLPSSTERFNPSGVLKDVGAIDIQHPVASVAQLLGGKIARSSLTGKLPPAPTSGLANDLAPIDRGPPQPPPGMSASTPTASPPVPAAPPGQISLADLLSHGVEQPPAPGLSLGNPPTQGGIPFQQNAGHLAGDLSLDESLTPRTYSGNNSDLAPVMSQGVPEGIMQRTSAPLRGTVATIDYPSGAQHPVFANNASGESAASQEAVNRTAEENASGRTRFLVDPDGNVTPLKGVDAVDAKAPKGSVIVQRGIGSKSFTLIDRGGLPESHANGLVHRAFGRSLGDEL